MNTMYNKVKSILITLLVTVSFTASAQTQQGIVKTRGRMVNGILQRGKGVPDAMVQIKEHSSVKSEKDGTFSFPLRTKNYLVESVKKQGYQLVDNDACRNYKYSEEPVCLVMETPEQQRSDLLAAERKIRRNLQRQLQEREEEIEVLKVSQKEKDSLLHIVYQQQTNNEKLINEMAKRYSTLDYDQLDEFYRQVSLYIENGELTRADSLLRTRGDINAQVKAIINQGQAIQEQSELLHKADSVHKRDIEEAARRCYGYYETFFAQHQNDSAAYYMELRASLDTKNVEWANTAGRFFHDIMANYPVALKYYYQILQLSIQEFGEQSEWVALSLNNIGSTYGEKGEYTKAIEYLTKSLSIREGIWGKDSREVAMSYNNIGVIYTDLADYSKALDFHYKALTIRERVLGIEHTDVANSYINIGLIYSCQGEYVNAMEYYSKALNILEKALGKEHAEVAQAYQNIGVLYGDQFDYDKALEYGIKALNILEKVYGKEHPAVALSYNNIGAIYYGQGNYADALCFFEKAVTVYEKTFDFYNKILAQIYKNIGNAYIRQGNNELGIKSYNKALTILVSLFTMDHPEVVSLINEIENLKYIQAVSIGGVASFMEDRLFVANVINGNTPAASYGLKGEYYLLEYGDWTFMGITSLLDTIKDYQGKAKDIVIMKDGIISQHHFENIIGVHFALKQIGKEEKESIIKKYNNWKKKR